MAANTSPIFVGTPDIQWNSYVTAANTTVDLTGGTIYLIFTADATNGGYLNKLVFRPTPGGTTTKTVARIWINNGSTTGTAANNVLIAEVGLPAVTADADDAVYGVEFPIEKALPASYRVYVTIHTGSANGWAVTGFGGKY